MANILTVFGRVLCAIFIPILAVLMGSAMSYFNTLPEKDQNRSTTACIVIFLFLLLIFLVVRLATM